MSIVDVESRLRSIRQKILQAMLNLPAIIANNVQPDTLALGELYGRQMLNVPTRSVKIGIIDMSTGLEVKTSQLTPWSTINVSEDTIISALADTIDKSAEAVVPIKVYSNGVTIASRSARRTGMASIGFTVNESDVQAIHSPPNYPPVYPLNVQAIGTVYEDHYAENYDLYVVIGNIGYKDASSRWVYGRGVAIYLGILNSGIMVRTLWGDLGVITTPSGQKTVQLIVVTGVWSLVASAAGVTW